MRSNIALQKARLYAAQPEDVLALPDNALRADFQWFEVDHRQVLRLALETGLTTYDATYLHLARLLDAPLVTFGLRLSRVYQGHR